MQKGNRHMFWLCIVLFFGLAYFSIPHFKELFSQVRLRRKLPTNDPIMREVFRIKKIINEAIEIEFDRRASEVNVSEMLTLGIHIVFNICDGCKLCKIFADEQFARFARDLYERLIYHVGGLRIELHLLSKKEYECVEKENLEVS